MKCPGQDSKYWKEDAIFDAPCPACGQLVEFYKDDTSRKCPGCDKRFINPRMDFGCASYCQHAEQCIGTLPEEFTGARDALFKDRVAVEVKRHFHTDFKSIRRATQAARFAEEIGKGERASLLPVLCAAYLHEVDLESARILLEKAKVPVEMLSEVLSNLRSLDGGLSSQGAESVESATLQDAILLVHLKEQSKVTDSSNVPPATTLHTETGRLLAQSLS